MNTQQFWIVWNPSKSHPKVCHDTYTRAIAEAERLADKEPGQEFCVMECKGIAKSMGGTYIETETGKDEDAGPKDGFEYYRAPDGGVWRQNIHSGSMPYKWSDSGHGWVETNPRFGLIYWKKWMDTTWNKLLTIREINDALIEMPMP